MIFSEMITSKCDVFSFGVVLFEIYSKGESPWAGISNSEVTQALRNDKRMPIPENFGPEWIVKLINNCWQKDPKQRPTFKVIIKRNYS